MKIKKNQGFTLIELMVVVTIIGVISMIAFPQYSEYLERGRRAEVKSYLHQIANVQERFFTINNSYAKLLTDLNVKSFTGVDEDSSAGTITMTSDGATWTLTGTFKKDDKHCTTMTLTNTGVQGVGVGDDKKICWK